MLINQEVEEIKAWLKNKLEKDEVPVAILNVVGYSYAMYLENYDYDAPCNWGKEPKTFSEWIKTF